MLESIVKAFKVWCVSRTHPVMSTINTTFSSTAPGFLREFLIRLKSSRARYSAHELIKMRIVFRAMAASEFSSRPPANNKGEKNSVSNCRESAYADVRNRRKAKTTIRYRAYFAFLFR